MTIEKNLKFGKFVRREREAKNLGLRKMAKMIGVSATYLSKVERDEFAPPAEDKVTKIARIIGCDTDELLALAGRVSSDLTEIIREHPRELAHILRGTRGSPEETAKTISLIADAMKKRNVPKSN